MSKERLGAFMDAVIAIVMTILVLELDLGTSNQFCGLCAVFSVACGAVDEPA